MKRKSFPFYYEKYIAGTAFLTRREKGSYVDLLCYQADKGRMKIEDIKDILGMDFDCWGKLKKKFIEENGIYYNQKMDEVKNGKKEIEPIGPALLQKRKDKFYNDLKPFLVKYPKDMLRSFFDYWTEKNKSNTHMRFELEKVFEISRRLATWANRDNNFNKDKKQGEAITYKELVYRFNQGETDMWEKYEQVTPGDKRSLWRPKNNRNESQH